jgi:hypothetical protein
MQECLDQTSKIPRMFNCKKRFLKKVCVSNFLMLVLLFFFFFFFSFLFLQHKTNKE